MNAKMSSTYKIEILEKKVFILSRKKNMVKISMINTSKLIKFTVMVFLKISDAKLKILRIMGESNIANKR